MYIKLGCVCSLIHICTQCTNRTDFKKKTISFQLGHTLIHILAESYMRRLISLWCLSVTHCVKLQTGRQSGKKGETASLALSKGSKHHLPASLKLTKYHVKSYLFNPYKCGEEKLDYVRGFLLAGSSDIWEALLLTWQPHSDETLD